MDAEPLRTPPEPPVAAELRALVKSAQGGDPSALPRIRKILDGHPEVWRHVGDLATLAERAWIAVLATDNPVAVESMKRTVAEMKADLAGESPTRVERLLVDHVIACWMEVSYLESISADPGRGTLEVPHATRAPGKGLLSAGILPAVSGGRGWPDPAPDDYPGEDGRTQWEEGRGAAQNFGFFFCSFLLAASSLRHRAASSSLPQSS